MTELEQLSNAKTDAKKNEHLRKMGKIVVKDISLYKSRISSSKIQFYKQQFFNGEIDYQDFMNHYYGLNFKSNIHKRDEFNTKADEKRSVFDKEQIIPDIVTFGKYKGKKLTDVIEGDTSYWKWALEKVRFLNEYQRNYILDTLKK